MRRRAGDLDGPGDLGGPPGLDVAAPAGRRRWAALVFIALAQLVIAVDVTVLNVALPSIQTGLGMPDGLRQWPVAAYTLAFGGLLLTGGRIADRFGHRRTFVAGLVAFALASGLAGAASGPAVLIVARVLQGAAGAVLSPSALALVSTTFTDARERARAFGVYSAVASSGLAAGLLVGGLLTQSLGWRWAFYLSAPCAVVAAVGAVLTVPASRRAVPPRPLDLAGCLLSTGGLVALVLTMSWAQGGTGRAAVVSAVVSVALLGAFVAHQRRARVPLVPWHLLRDRARTGVLLAVLLAVMGLFGLFLLTTYYLQGVRGMSPLATGTAFLPLVVAMAVGATQVAGRRPHDPPWRLVAGGFVLALVAVVLMTRLRVDSTYAAVVLPSMVLLGVGLGMIFVPSTNRSTAGVDPQSVGAVSALYVTVQQVGAAVGTVLVNGAATSATARWVAAHPGTSRTDPEAIIQGFTTSLWWTVALLVAGLLVAVTLVRGRDDVRRGGRLPAGDVDRAPADPTDRLPA